ncbi:MAG TPA: transglycosylase SLT domain-containing protein [Methylobacterium sp.]|jgi:soluble lytic murein transglycosylase-like protein|uniref:transglycosylase SLT domain-containing protein n=1 Tax=Methylorubrum sp. B1-46 TaxID=2897334 RepID=UPI001E4A249E|nr:transglycosylase SLT domain-containing protein [Methylorubrum sp. B1-46]UGB26652.1 transglycosylase SLT domain-containing protein [Methylorubrum sp. B1-46]HEV2544638.1 transglycosylase SLT domain-containing protein [Methylobacterium sp.]
MRRILAGAITAACISSAAGPNAATAHSTAAEGAAEAASAQTSAMGGDARGSSKRPPMAGASRVCERQMAQAAAKHGVPLGMLYAVGLTESGNRGSLQPYAMNIGGKAYFGSTAADVVQRLTQAQQEGVRLVDLGCMQINHHYHRAKFASLEAMIDPAQNVEYATRFLKELKEREGSWTLAVARYHAGPNNNPAQKLYVCRVITNMVASGFGNWTPGAKAFCQ